MIDYEKRFRKLEQDFEALFNAFASHLSYFHWKNGELYFNRASKLIIDSESLDLIKAMKSKRQKEYLSIRKLSKILDISFSSLARMERGEGGPDIESRIKILEWINKL